MLPEGALAEQFGVFKTPGPGGAPLAGPDRLGRPHPREGYMVRPVEFSAMRDIFSIRRTVESSLAPMSAEPGTASPRPRTREPNRV